MTEPSLVDAAWALEHLDDPAVRFVEVDVDTEAYDRGHIPGAVAWDWTRQLCDSVRRDIVGRDALAALLAESGIGRDTLVVLYGDHNNWFAAWAYWQLKLFGLERLALLDGGRKFWLDSGHPLTREPERSAGQDAEAPDEAVPPEEAAPLRPAPVADAATSAWLPEPSFELRAFRDDVLSAVRDGSAVLVDVRSPAEYTGEVVAPPGTTEMAQRGGHIPGAVSVPWSEAVREDGTFRPRDELAALYAAVGVTPEREVVTYCRIGERSSHTWFVLHELLEFPRVRNYDGSWSEWGSMVGMPIEKGLRA